MIQEPIVTERDARLRERAAYKAGVAAWGFNTEGMTDVGEIARRRYPITRKVPRVVDLGHFLTVRLSEYRDSDILFELRHKSSGGGHLLPPETIDVLADLLANPFGEVEE